MQSSCCHSGYLCLLVVWLPSMRKLKWFTAVYLRIMLEMKGGTVRNWCSFMEIICVPLLGKGGSMNRSSFDYRYKTGSFFCHAIASFFIRFVKAAVLNSFSMSFTVIHSRPLLASPPPPSQVVWVSRHRKAVCQYIHKNTRVYGYSPSPPLWTMATGRSPRWQYFIQIRARHHCYVCPTCSPRNW